jgi:hypothetical protein
VTPDLDTLLIALYVEIDDHVIPSGECRPGQPKRLSDAELVCLAVAQVLLGARSEHHWLRMCYCRLGHPTVGPSRNVLAGEARAAGHSTWRSRSWDSAAFSCHRPITDATSP